VGKLEKELEEKKQSVEALESTSSKTNRELTEVKTDLSIVDKDKQEALTTLKEANSFEVNELRTEHDVLQQRIKGLQTDLTEHKSLLNSTLLDLALVKDRAHSSEKAKDEYTATLEAIKAHKDGREDGYKGSLEDRAVKLTEQRVRDREVLTKRTEHIKKQNTMIKELQAKVSILQEGDENAMALARAEEATLHKVRCAGLLADIFGNETDLFCRRPTSKKNSPTSNGS
jgi:chromosome segregation ATPase